MTRKKDFFWLHGDREGQFASSLYDDNVLVMTPNHTPIPLTASGNVDPSRITKVMIEGIIHYRLLCYVPKKKTYSVDVMFLHPCMFSVCATTEQAAINKVYKKCGHSPFHIKATHVKMFGWDFAVDTKIIGRVTKVEKKQYIVDMAFMHRGKFYVHAASAEEAKLLVEKCCSEKSIEVETTDDAITWKQQKIVKQIGEVKEESQHD